MSIFKKLPWSVLWVLIGAALSFQIYSIIFGYSLKSLPPPNPESLASKNASSFHKEIISAINRTNTSPTQLTKWKALLKELPNSEEYKTWFNDRIRNDKIWQNPPSHGYKACTNASASFSASKPNFTRGFLLVNANGGLNQMRAGICDMVVIARILNATLVVPELDKKSFWMDSSTFEDVFDIKHFISSLKNDVSIVRKLPDEFKYAETARAYFSSWGKLEYYKTEVSKNWIQYKIIHALKSDSRLDNHLPLELQKLRCRTHFGALQFAPQIERFAKKLVSRMRRHGPYIALHLRYEKDMLAFSGCTYGLSKAEAEELTAVRMQTKHWREKKIDPNSQRFLGLCPLSPSEVGLLLLSLGFPRHTQIYIASGEIFGGEEKMQDLKSMFPNLKRKESLATEEELAGFKPHMNMMAALDYYVSVESDVFLPTYSGNMAKAVEGHRRFLGHRRTISPNSRGIVLMFDQLERGERQWNEEFWDRMQLIHMHRQGGPRPRKGPVRGSHGKDKQKSEESFYSNPLPECFCQAEQFRFRGGLASASRRGPPKLAKAEKKSKSERKKSKNTTLVVGQG